MGDKLSLLKIREKNFEKKNYLNKKNPNKCK